MREQILAYALKYNGEYDRMKKAIQNDEDWQMPVYEGHYVTIIDDDYPKALLLLEDPPFILFYKGDLGLLKGEYLGVIGSRLASQVGLDYTSYLINKCPSRYGIVSGLAKGIDAAAHSNAIRTGRKTIGVIGCGINRVYPKENRLLYESMSVDHLILSEYPDDAPPYASHFPWRNRIIAALAKRIIVVEAKEKSGTLLTVNEALKLDKDIYVFPYRYDDKFGKGCNMLIQQGANMLVFDEEIENL